MLWPFGCFTPLITVVLSCAGSGARFTVRCWTQLTYAKSQTPDLWLQSSLWQRSAIRLMSWRDC